jgi:hypothetical protein
MTQANSEKEGKIREKELELLREKIAKKIKERVAPRLTKAK